MPFGLHVQFYVYLLYPIFTSSGNFLLKACIFALCFIFMTHGIETPLLLDYERRD